MASRLARHRRVIAVDFRGRGLSQNAVDPASYRPDVELADTIDLLNHLAVDRVAVLGTSRGGIVAMLMAALHRDRLAGIMLNDIGPRLEATGLLRIRSYLGVETEFGSWDQAIQSLQRSNPEFESLTEDEWRAFAQRVFKLVNGKPRIDYDPALASTFPSVEAIQTGNIAQLWEIFSATIDMPLSVLRGEFSDLLSPETVGEMKHQNADLDATTIPNRGHAPFLDEDESLAAIARWLEHIDAKEKGR